MRTVEWILSCSHKEDHKKIALLCKRGRLVQMTTVCGAPVCWRFELDGAYDKKTGEPVLIKAFVTARSA